MKKFLALSLSDVVFIMLINVGILTFMSRINFMLSWIEHEKCFITPRPSERPGRNFQSMMYAVHEVSFFKEYIQISC